MEPRNKKLVRAEIKRLKEEKREVVREIAHLKQVRARFEKFAKGEKLEANEFYNMVMEPGFPDSMVFQLTREESDEKDKTFSREGMETVSIQIHDFLMARLFGRWKETDVPPGVMRIEVKIKWEPENLQEGEWPYFEAELEEGLKRIDGARRVPMTFE